MMYEKSYDNEISNITYEVFRKRRRCLSSSFVFEFMSTSLVKLGQSSLPFYCLFLSIIISVFTPFLLLA
jgi:hypothetical protein